MLPTTHIFWRFRLAARTHASHAWNTGSIPVGATKNRETRLFPDFAFVCFARSTLFKGHCKIAQLALIPPHRLYYHRRIHKSHQYGHPHGYAWSDLGFRQKYSAVSP